MSVLSHFGVGGTDEKSAGHAKMNDPLRSSRLLGLRTWLDQVKHDMFAGTADVGDLLGEKRGFNFGCGRFQRLGFGAEPDGFDHVPCEAFREPACDGFDFRKFWHRRKTAQPRAPTGASLI